MSGDYVETSRSEVNRISVSVADRRTAEALSLEVRRLAKSLGVEVGEIRVELADESTPKLEQVEGSE
ncbi:MAG TPA: hypothetical protein VFY57_03165 [Rubrobacteraceae bacterium]|nr:hypothetical protein [Rubrobacteraceae bacterium]